MKIVAHRGASWEAPENTIPSILLAWRERADAVEIDVRLTADGKIVLMHDETTARTSRESLEVARVRWDALKPLDVGAWKSPRFRSTPIPLLRDVLKMIPGGRQLWIEIKCGAEILPPLRDEMEVHRLPPQAIGFLGFSPYLMALVKQAFPRYSVYLNVEPRGEVGAPDPWTAEHVIDLARRHGLDGVSAGMCDAVDERFISEILAAGLGLIVWVVDDEHVALKLARAGLPALMTNRPDFLRHRLRVHGIH